MPPLPTLVVIIALFLSCGCSMGSFKIPPPPPQRGGGEVRPASLVSRTNEPIREAAREELGPAAADVISKAKRPPVKPVDPGAAALIESMLPKLRDRAFDSSGISQISLSRIRNQSRAAASEYTAFCERFADLLNHAAPDSHLNFTCDPQTKVQYQLLGTAYLASVEGFDVWELYLSLSPAPPQQAIDLWRPPTGPIRILRQPRAGQPQILQP